VIAVAGTLVADILAHPVARLPTPGGLERVAHIALHSGGVVANTGVALSRLGVSVAAVVRLGRDALGRHLSDEIKVWATAHFLSFDQSVPTSSTLVFVGQDGERSFLLSSGAGERFSTRDLPLDRLSAAGVRALHLGYLNLLSQMDTAELIALLLEARERGFLVSLDVTWDPATDWDRVRAVLPHIDLFCPNLREASAITRTRGSEAAACALLELGVRQAVAVTLGADGCVLATPHLGLRKCAGLEVQVQDTTGAGDAFVAGMLAGWYRGLDWEVCARVAGAVASLSVTKLGVSEGVIGWDDTWNWLEGAAYRNRL